MQDFVIYRLIGWWHTKYRLIWYGLPPKNEHLSFRAKRGILCHSECNEESQQQLL